MKSHAPYMTLFSRWLLEQFTLSVPEPLCENTLVSMAMACCLPLYTSRLEITQRELFTVRFDSFDLISASTRIGEPDGLRVCAILYVMVPFLGSDRKSVSSSSVGVTLKLHSVHSKRSIAINYDDPCIMQKC